MVADTDALSVIKHLPSHHLFVKGNRLAQLRIPRLVKFVNDEASSFPLCRLKCFPVGYVGAMYGFGFGADYSGRVFGNQFVLHRPSVRMREQFKELLSVVSLVHYEADEVVFSPVD